MPNKTPLLCRYYFIMKRYVNYVSLKQKDAIFMHLTILLLASGKKSRIKRMKVSFIYPNTGII